MEENMNKNMKNDNLDKIQSRLNISEMDKASKKDLFNKFESVGGKVVNLEAKKPLPTPQKSNNIPRNVKVGNHSVRPVQENLNPFADTGTHVTVTTQGKLKKDSEPEIKKVSGFQVFIVRLTCMFANIFNFSATQFSQKFTKMTLGKIYTELGMLKVILNPIFQETTADSLAFRDYLANKELLFEYELAHHTYNMLDEQWFINLKSTMPVSVNKSENLFKLICGRLFLFYPYHIQMQTAVQLIARNYELYFHKKIHNSYTPKKINDIFASIWGEWYIWVEELINYYRIRHNSTSSYQTLEEFLDFNSESTTKVGQLSIELKEFYKQKKEEELVEAEEKQASLYPSDAIQRGIEFIKENIDFEQYMESFSDAKDLRSLFTPTDQLFYAYVLVDYFDKEYTIWNDINFYVIPGGRTGRFDAKKEIKMLSSQLTKFYELINDHLRFLRTTGMVQNAKSGLEIDEKKQKEMSRNSFTIRQNLLSVFELFSSLLTQVIDSKGSAKEMVGNWDEVLIDTKNQELKILYKKQVEEILRYAQDYISAIVWLLKYSDLSGLSGKTIEMKVLTNQLINNSSNESINSEKEL